MTKTRFLLLSIIILATAGLFIFGRQERKTDDLFLSYIADPKKVDIRFYWKDEQQNTFKSIDHLKTWLTKNNKQLLFAMNGGMYKQDNSPQGLFIDNKKMLVSLDTASGNGNFYLKPNGVFYITTANVPAIGNTANFRNDGEIKYATQSGPMLVIDGEINSVFKLNSTNTNIRNGVGILPDNKIIFVMSKKEINFYDFANYFKKAGCKNALYLDGFVSRTYLPEQHWEQTDGNFGVIIGATIDK